MGGSGRVVTAGFSRHSDRQVAVWNDDNLSAPLHEETIDSSSGIVFPYYDPDTNILYLAGKVGDFSNQVLSISYLCTYFNGNVLGLVLKAIYFIT